jgi:hypothetical protein
MLEFESGGFLLHNSENLDPASHRHCCCQLLRKCKAPHCPDSIRWRNTLQRRDLEHKSVFGSGSIFKADLKSR